MNSYELSRAWFDFSFDNPEKIKPSHSAVYFFAIEHCNRLGWKEKFGFPSQMVMEAVGIKNWRTYSGVLSDLVGFGFISMIEISKNQYSSNIIAIVNNTKATTEAGTKALDKALQKHSTKHSTKQGQSTVSIVKQYNNITNNKEQGTIKDTPSLESEIDIGLMKTVDMKFFHEYMEVYKEIKPYNIVRVHTSCISLFRESCQTVMPEQVVQAAKDYLEYCGDSSTGVTFRSNVEKFLSENQYMIDWLIQNLDKGGDLSPRMAKAYKIRSDEEIAEELPYTFSQEYIQIQIKNKQEAVKA